MAFGMASEYAVAALLVALAVWKLATNEGLDAFVWGFAMLWFTGIALQFSREQPTWPAAPAFDRVPGAMDDDRRAPQWPRAAPS